MSRKMRSLRIDLWPAADREAWHEALRARVGWRKGGAAAHQRPATNADLQRRYGYFLRFCIDGESFDPNAPVAGHITEARVEAYIAHVQSIWSSITVFQSARKLSRLAGIIAPDRDFGWLRELVLDLKAIAEPSVRRPFVSARALMDLGLKLGATGSEMLEANPEKAARLIRDGMIIALLTACPLRARNFAHLELGRSIKIENGHWWIILEAHETKNGRADLRLVPDYLVAPLETYLRRSRPVLTKARAGSSEEPPRELHDLVGPLWLSCFGRALDEQGLHIITTRETRKTLGVPVNPHAFRAAAANTAAMHGAAMPHLASAILQHSDPRVTEAHYNRVRTFEAADALRGMLRGESSSSR